MNTTYRELLEALQRLTPEQLDMNATVFVRGVDEFYPVQTFGVSDDYTDIIDPNQPYMLV